MTRRRSTPWIHRWSRHLMGAIAVLGALVTGYLTVVKLSGNTAACPTEGCERVLSSPYAEVFGIPLTLFGLLAYISMAVFALAPLAVGAEGQAKLREQLEKWTWLLLFAGGTAMAIFSGYLMYLIAFKIQALCIYCLTSALLSLSLFVLAVIGHAWEDMGQMFFIGIVVGMITLISTLGIYASVENATTGGKPIPPGPIPAFSGNPDPQAGGWPITTQSGPAELALADHLNQMGVKIYGAYWCPHCHEQKLILGKEAYSRLKYIECDPKGKNSQTELCLKVGIKSYPTWEINGKLEPGVQEGAKLAAATGYSGPMNFKYSLSRR